jgi:hypothetical protein
LAYFLIVKNPGLFLPSAYTDDMRGRTREPYPVKKLVGFNCEMLAAIDKWREHQEIRPSANAAIRALIRRGLTASKQTLREARE